MRSNRFALVILHTVTMRFESRGADPKVKNAVSTPWPVISLFFVFTGIPPADALNALRTSLSPKRKLKPVPRASYQRYTRFLSGIQSGAPKIAQIGVI